MAALRAQRITHAEIQGAHGGGYADSVVIAVRCSYDVPLRRHSARSPVLLYDEGVLAVASKERTERLP